MAVDPEFTDFITPYSTQYYSKEALSMTTISELVELSYPHVAPANSVTWIQLSPEVVSSAASTVILPGEILPHYDDLRTVSELQTLAGAYQLGM